MSPIKQTTPEVRPAAPIVEQRLGHAFAAMDCLYRIALIADEPHHGIPLFSDLRTFADLVRQFTSAAQVHLRAVKGALPASCTNLEAPDAGGQS